MTPIDVYLLCKIQREMPRGVPALASVLGDFRVPAEFGAIRPIDVATPDNATEIVRSDGEVGLVFDHNYFAYFSDLLACFFSEDGEAVERHLNYLVNRFLLEAALRHDSYELIAGLLHVILLCDPEGNNPLGQPPLHDAGYLSDKLRSIHDFQRRFTVAHEIGHLTLAVHPEGYRSARVRLRYLLDGLRRQQKKDQDDEPGEQIHDLVARLASQSSDEPSRPADATLAEFLCDNVAADVLGRSMAEGGVQVGLVGYDLVFATDAYFLFMWFLEALRHRIDGIFEPNQSPETDDPEMALFRGNFVTFQFLLTHLARFTSARDNVLAEAGQAGERSRTLLQWLITSLAAAQSNDNLETIVRVGARTRSAYNLPFDNLRRAALAALGWPCE